MRIVAGKYKGRGLATPQDQMIRPTTDRIRESLFSIVGHYLAHDFSNRRVLDLFAGTGALGLEALSRGCRFCVFVETSIEGRSLIQSNIEAFALQGQTRILRRDATRLGVVGTMQPFNLVFADPPYNKGLGQQALISAYEGGWLGSDALIVLEESKQAEIALPDKFTLHETRQYGATQLLFFGLAH